MPTWIRHLRISKAHLSTSSSSRFSETRRLSSIEKPARPSTRIRRFPTPPPSKQDVPKPPAPPEPPAPQKRSLWDPLLPRDHRTRSQLYYLVLIAPIIALAALHAPFNIMNVTGQSMSPIFNAECDPDADLPDSHHDAVLVQRGITFDVNWNRRRARGEEVESDDFKRGDIVTFYTPHASDKVAVKRIIGMPGDRVQPLSGYPGGEEAVIVPWNHVWVEGDVDSREKSMDSNWYGPISQNLIIGKVKAILTPWYSPKWIDVSTHVWPARRKGRVVEGAVREASVNPDAIARNEAWDNGTNQKVLQRMRDDPEKLLMRFRGDKKMREEVRNFYRSAAMVIAAGDPDSDRYELAQDIISKMDQIYGRQVMMKGMIRKHAGGVENNKTSLDREERDSSGREAALAVEKVLKEQGWTIERDADGKVRSQLPQVSE